MNHSLASLAQVHGAAALPSVELIYFEGHRSKDDAIRREKYFKTAKGKTTLKQMLRGSLSQSEKDSFLRRGGAPLGRPMGKRASIKHGRGIRSFSYGKTCKAKISPTIPSLSGMELCFEWLVLHHDLYTRTFSVFWKSR
jgi:hypothetical protein